MAFIVLSHACVHSNFQYSASTMSLNSLFVQWGYLGNLGVDIYVLISGYFLCRKSNHCQSLIRLFLQVWFYSLFLFFVCRYGFQHSYTAKDYLQVILPTIFQEYWFFTAYVVLGVFSPYVNHFLDKAGQKMHRNLLVSLFAIWILIPTVTRQEMYGGPLTQLLFFYCVGAYFRLYPDEVFRDKKTIARITTAAFVLLFASTVVLNYLGQYISLFQHRGKMFYGRDSLLIAVCAIGMFAIFANMKSFSKPFINAVASCTFGVYLIHDNPAMRHILWERIFKLAEKFYSPYLIIYILHSVIVVFCVSTLIEHLRQRIFDAQISSISARIAGKLGDSNKSEKNQQGERCDNVCEGRTEGIL